MSPSNQRPIRYTPRSGRTFGDRIALIAAVCLIVWAALMVAAVQVYGPAIARWLAR